MTNETLTTPPARVGYRDNSWQLTDMIDQAPGFYALSDVLIDLTDQGHPIVAGTADLKYSNGLARFQQCYPDRFLQFGISEQNMVSVAAGLATTGLAPYVATFASFMSLLAVEQVRTDTAYTKQPVTMIGHHAGFTLGFYGASHHATEDIAITRSMANMTVVAPADPRQLAALVRASADLNGPMYLRTGRGREPEVYGASDLTELQIGRAVVHGFGSDVTLIATGTMVHPTLQAADLLGDRGIDAGVVDMHTLKPLDGDTVMTGAQKSSLLVTVEEHNIIGGLGGAVAETLTDHGAGVRLVRHGVRDHYVPVGPPTHLYRHLGLDPEGIAQRVQDALGREGSFHD